ncbi:TetR/AcrR family transcriptional regulator [Protaetiibacter larvae]|uniref:Helix-turn-helix transcriptional regulator n=1 Tax=Protaetiibacter larvae TaxID=2592654 RepID=A0A5C1Y6H2_9MICO|nr:TetR/AcrR family transcriptional regulator [Protaetiibacter larvae]QEO08562.1 helix-turn-helix transcriptional regulator [Protaetiibacter larvae]
MQTTASGLLQAALEEFASDGYLATSLQSIADRAGVSKASVLYHYGSKETLLDAVLSPAIDEISALLPLTAKLAGSEEDRATFLEAFVDLLLRHRLASQIFITQSGALGDVPVVARAHALIQQIAIARPQQSVDDQVRFAVALGGAAYLLAQTGQFEAPGTPDDEALRASLIRILGELLAPVTA